MATYILTAAQLNNRILNSFSIPSSGGSVDPDAQAFITVAGITDPTQQSAINTLVVGFKDDGLWTKMKAIYPIVGGTATTHKYNLKDPRDLDAAFRLQFNGGITHSSTGVLPNGTNGYANTFFIPSVQIANADSFHFSMYSRTNGAWTNSDIGVIEYDGDENYIAVQAFWGINEYASDFDYEINKGLSANKQNQNSPNFYKGKLYPGTEGTLYLIAFKVNKSFPGDDFESNDWKNVDYPLIPNGNRQNRLSFQKSANIGILKPEFRDIKNLKFYQYNPDIKKYVSFII